MTAMETPPVVQPTFGAAEIGAIAHLYRGEMYRSTVSAVAPGCHDQLGGR